MEWRNQWANSEFSWTLAHPLNRERGHSLQTTALVNEACMRPVDYKRMQWQNRAHFLAVSARAMRRILVDRARPRNVKRGADAEHVSLDAAAVLCPDASSDFVSVDDALTRWRSGHRARPRAAAPLCLGGVGFTGRFGALYPIYVRGVAYLAARQPAEAVRGFQRIVDHRTIALVDPMDAMARL